MLGKIRLPILFVAILLAGGIVFGLRMKPDGVPGRENTSRDPGPGKGQLTDRRTSPANAILEVRAALEMHPVDTHAALRGLRERLFQGDRLAAAAAVADFLRSGADADTLQPFVVGEDGGLSRAPSLRTALLDWLPALDPQLALEMAREILRTTRSPDEYALALRNLAWNDLDGDLHPEISAALQQMFDHKEWNLRPSAGFLEAFDVAVDLGDLATFLSLAKFASPDVHEESVVHAACMSMDRMILRDPSLLASASLQSPEWLADAPLQRASLMSRLDITRDDHRALFLGYLESAAISDAERQTFLSIFPNGNQLHGNFLVTRGENAPDIATRATMDRAVLTEIDKLSPDASPQTRQSLEKIKSRILQRPVLPE